MKEKIMKLLLVLPSIIKSFAKWLLAIIVSSLTFLGESVYFILDAILPLSKIAAFIYRRFPGLWKKLLNVDFIKRTVSKGLVRKFGKATPFRPHSFTAASDEYSAWFGFVDRSYSGRHLAPETKDIHYTNEQDLANLFVRSGPYNTTKKQINCERSSLLFAAFAQWFTDSFLRTEHGFVLDKHGNVKRDDLGRILRHPDRFRKNTSNHEIDLCQIYGLSEAQTDLLRLKSETQPGLLKFQIIDGEEYPVFLLDDAPADAQSELIIKNEFVGLHAEPTLRPIFENASSKENYLSLFAVGLEHGNATISNSLMNTIFLREHNRIAKLLSQSYPSWNDERVFQTARNIMIVILLNIVISDYIRHIAPFDLPLEVIPGYADEQTWYRSNRVALEFNLLYRWHSLVPDKFSFFEEQDPKKNPKQFLHNNSWLIKNGVGKTLDSFSKERAGKIALGNTPSWMIGVEADTISLMRQAKLQTYNEYRKRFSLKPLQSFDQLTKDSNQIDLLSKSCNGNIDDLEWYLGLFAEEHQDYRIMGELMLTMVAHDAFTQALTNPLLAKNIFNEETFSKTGWAIVNETRTLKQVVDRVVQDSNDYACSFTI